MSNRKVSADVEVEDVVGRRERCVWKRLRRTEVRGCVTMLDGLETLLEDGGLPVVIEVVVGGARRCGIIFKRLVWGDVRGKWVANKILIKRLNE